MNLTEAPLHALKANGARQIFGIPGDFALPFFRIVEESGLLPLYTLSHEPAVGFAADAAARIDGTLGVAAVTYGAGVLNMINAVAARARPSSPATTRCGWVTSTSASLYALQPESTQSRYSKKAKADGQRSK
jgi:indolepyruvate decarboxylase